MRAFVGAGQDDGPPSENKASTPRDIVTTGPRIISIDILMGSRRERRLPSPTHGDVLHPAGGHRRRGAGHRGTRGGVHDGDGVATAGGGGLVQLEVRLLALEGGRDEGGRRRVEREGGGDRLGLLGGGGVGRDARERGPLRGAVDGHQLTGPVSRAGGPGRRRTAAVTHIAIRQEVGAELQVILEVEGFRRLEPRAESQERRGVGHLLHAAGAPELLPLGVLRHGEPRRSPVAAVVVVRVGDAGHGGGRVRMLGVIICRHIVWSVGEVEGGAGGAVRLLFSRAVMLAGGGAEYVRMSKRDTPV